MFARLFVRSISRSQHQHIDRSVANQLQCKRSNSNLINSFLGTRFYTTDDYRTESSNSENYPSKRIYVGNIPYSADERDVRDLFSAYNGVQKFMIKTDRVTGQSLGYGFLDMENEAQAAVVLDTIKDDGLTVQDRRLTVQYAHSSGNTRPPNNVLFIRSFDGGEEDLKSALGEHAENIQSVNIKSSFTDSSKKFCRVTFDTIQNATAALQFIKEDLPLGSATEAMFDNQERNRSKRASGGNSFRKYD